MVVVPGKAQKRVRNLVELQESKLNETKSLTQGNQSPNVTTSTYFRFCCCCNVCRYEIGNRKDIVQSHREGESSWKSADKLDSMKYIWTL